MSHLSFATINQTFIYAKKTCILKVEQKVGFEKCKMRSFLVQQFGVCGGVFFFWLMLLFPRSSGLVEVSRFLFQDTQQGLGTLQDLGVRSLRLCDGAVQVGPSG